MERKIGEAFEFEGKKIEVKVASNGCDGCFLKEKCCIDSADLVGTCGAGDRTDKKHVVFVEVQERHDEKINERKVGEVFENQGKKLKVVEVERNMCFGCYFFDGVCCQKTDRGCGHCEQGKRTDYKPIIFVEVKDEQQQEQVEPQKLNLCEILKHCPNGELFWSPLLGDVKLYDIDEEAKTIDVTTKDLATWEINADGTITIDDITSEVIMLYPSRERCDWSNVKYEPKKEKFDPKTFKAFDKVLYRAKQIDLTWHCDFFSHMKDRIYVCSRSVSDYVVPYNDDTKHLVGTKDEAPEYYRYWED